ncbi:MAG: ferritin [Chloroflexi bacterium]|nr:ferritin [Chloroflexota bacterium]
MQISKAMSDLMNAQIGNELGASNQYLQLSAYFDGQALKKLAELFKKQAEEEREHAMKFFDHLNEVGAPVNIPAIAAPKYDVASAEEAFKMAVDWEKEVTRQIYAMVDLSITEKDYASQNFLQWFVAEQVEEVSSMENYLAVVQRAGEKNLLMLEAYFSHQ